MTCNHRPEELASDVSAWENPRDVYLKVSIDRIADDCAEIVQKIGGYLEVGFSATTPPG